MPVSYVSKVLQQLAKGGFIKSVKGRHRGYVFARPPEEVSLLALFEALEGPLFFDDCPLRHCACGGTAENCRIFAQWISATRRVKDMLEETSIVSAAWNHPEHRFNVLPQRDSPGKARSPRQVPVAPNEAVRGSHPAAG